MGRTTKVHTRAFQFMVVFALVSSPAFAQTETPTGHEVSVSLGGYKYVEPGDTNISIHGPKFGAEYAGTFSLSQSRHWFAQANVRGTTGHTTYDGWCSPFMITPDSSSPNGYLLDVGDPSPCSENGNKDW